jgi:hypothetical protein
MWLTADGTLLVVYRSWEWVYSPPKKKNLLFAVDLEVGISDDRDLSVCSAMNKAACFNNRYGDGDRPSRLTAFLFGLHKNERVKGINAPAAI